MGFFDRFVAVFKTGASEAGKKVFSADFLAKADITQLRDVIKDLDKDLIDLKIEKASREEPLNKKEKMISELTDEMNSAVEYCNSMPEEQKTSTVYKAYRKKAEDIFFRIKELEEEVAPAKAEVEEIDQKITAASEVINAAKDRLNQLQNSRSMNSARNSLAENQSRLAENLNRLQGFDKNFGSELEAKAKRKELEAKYKLEEAMKGMKKEPKQSYEDIIAKDKAKRELDSMFK